MLLLGGFQLVFSYCRWETGVLVFFYPHLTLDRLIEWNLRVCWLYIWNLLDRIEKNFHKMVVIEAVKLDKDGVFSCHKVTFHNFWNPFEGFDDIRVLVCFGQRNADKSTYVKSESLRFHEETWTCNNSIWLKSLHSLVNGSSRNGILAFLTRKDRIFWSILSIW